MKLEQFNHHYVDGWEKPLEPHLDGFNTLVIVFGCSSYFGRSDVFQDLKKAFVTSTIIGCSGGGVFANDDLMEDSLIATVVRFEDTRLCPVGIFNQDHLGPEQMGECLAKKLDAEDLVSVLVLCDGFSGNGDYFLKGLKQSGLSGVNIWGGLAGDSSQFSQNWVYWDGSLVRRGVVGIGFYGAGLEVRTHSGGGWKDLGPKRRITSSNASRVFAVDNRPILELYSDYLGEYARELPAIGVRYPLMVESSGSECDGYLRSVVEIDEPTQSMRFGGSIPEGATVQMKRGDLDSLLKGAKQAASSLSEHYSNLDEGIIVACNCVGRRMVLGSQANLELQTIRTHLPEAMPMIGFYSLGEFSPSSGEEECEYVNETVTLTALVERHETSSSETV